MLLKRDRLKKGTARDIILASAENVFSEKGFAGSTIDEIASQAGVTKKLLYYHFKSKHDILDEVFKKHLQDVLDKADDFFAVEGVSENDFVSSFIDNLFSFLETKRKVIKIFTIESVISSQNALLLKMLEPIIALFDKKMREFHLYDYDKCDDLDRSINQLFLGLVPICTFFAFGDNLADYYRIGINELKEKFKTFLKNILLLNSTGGDFSK